MSEIHGETSFRAQAQVERSKEFWAYSYAALGFGLAVEGNLVQMLGVAFPCNVIAYVALMTGTVWLFYCSWMQERLFRLKQRMEDLENIPR